MPRTIFTPRHEALREFIKAKRKSAKLTQAQLAKKVGLYQSFVADFERGERRLDAVQFLDFAEALRFDPGAAIRKIDAP
jgi:transcriptional regulator with XRE-family HTH domain